jgi:hypothetical protein
MAQSKAEKILEQIIEVGAKIEQIVPILLPGTPLPYVGIGLQVVKFIANEFNAARANNDPELVLPSDSELIDKLEATANRIVENGQSFLDDGGQGDQS